MSGPGSTLAWERRGLVQVAVAATNHPAPTGDPQRQAVTAAEVARMIACPTCGARVHQACRTATGNATEHVARLIPRRCLCGDVVEGSRRYCEACRASARRRTYWRREVLHPTATRRRAPTQHATAPPSTNETSTP